MNPASNWFAKGMATLRGRDQPSEGDVSGIIVRPCLSEVLGIDDHSIHAEQSSPGGRPDFVCRRQGRVELIVEVKNLDTNLERRVGSGWYTSPVGQLQKYMRRFPGAQDGTWGLLTNASEWRLFRRSTTDCILQDICTPQSLDELREFLHPIMHERHLASRVPIEIQGPSEWALRLQIANITPGQFVEMSAMGRETHQKKEHGIEWAWAQLNCPVVGARTPSEPTIVVACIRLPALDYLIKPPDITEAMADMPVEYASQVHGVALVRGGISSLRCCAFLWHEGQLRTTATFDPHLPGSRVERQLSTLARLDNRSKELSSLNDVLEALDREALQESFYTQINDWFNRTLRTVNELRYLVRIMFAWILQERGILPDMALWNHRPVSDDGTEIHDRIERLFTEVLAVELDSRRTDLDRNNEIPFLNGSLFTELEEGDRPQRLSNSFYRSSRTHSKAGILDILARYDWTLSEPTSSEMETALDPSMLGLLFERLMLNIESHQSGRSGRDRRMPGGTYYTPQDVADTMVADAIAIRLGSSSGIDWKHLHQLTSPVPTEYPWQEWSDTKRACLRTELHNLTVLDPCCGSGVFTVAMLQALRRCLRRLGADSEEASLERIIERQLHSADVHPLAILITRLRLFISIVESRLDENKLQAIAPLPNLETRCVCADTLQIKLSDQITIADEDWKRGIQDLQAAMEMWVSAHSSRDKQIAREVQEEARSSLRELSALGMNTEWLDTDLIHSTEKPASVDIRLLLAVPDGWDIVIGNPPYQNISRIDRRRFHELGYRATSDLYTLFLEAALAVTKPNGCIVMITPHSIVFKRQNAWIELREKYERACSAIHIRTYDNRSTTMFPKLPWLKGEGANENGQRVTILSSKKSGIHQPKSRIFSQGLIRLDSRDRRKILQFRQQGICQLPSIIQWTQAPTHSTLSLLKKMYDSDQTEFLRHQTGATRITTFPQTARYFLTCLPDGLIENRSRKTIFLADDEFFWPWIGLYNSHLFHGLWLMLGDAFHLTNVEIKSVMPPPSWQNEHIRAETEHLAKMLCSVEVISKCRSAHTGPNSTKWPNVNFHQAPAECIVEMLDRLLIRAYGLDVEPLLTELRTMRIGSAHQIWARSDP